MAIERQVSRGTGAAFGRTLAIGVLLIGATALLLARLDWIGQQLGSVFRETKVDRTQPALLQAINDLAEYHASSGVFEVVVDLEHDTRLLPSFVSGDRTLFIAYGSVDGVIDFNALGPNSVRVDKATNRVTVVLPRPHLDDPALDLERSRVFERSRGVFDRIGDSLSSNPSDERELHLLALQRLRSAAAASDVGRRAESNTEHLLETLLRPLGYAEVRVDWIDPVAKTPDEQVSTTSAPNA